MEKRQKTFEDYNRNALKFELDMDKLVKAAKEHVIKNMYEHLRTINEIMDDIDISIGFFYDNLEKGMNASMRKIQYRISQQDKDILCDVDVASITEIEDRKNRVLNEIKDKIRELGAEPADNYIELRNVYDRAEFDKKYWVIWSIKSECGENKDVTESMTSLFVRNVIFKFLCSVFRSWDEIDNVSKNSEQLDKLAKDTAFHYLHEYINIVFAVYHLDNTVVKRISLMRYETRECYGKVIFLTKVDFEKLEHKIQFQIEPEFTDVDFSRKMLESATGNIYLAVDIESQILLGLVEISQTNRENKYIIYNGIGKYEVRIGIEDVLIYDREEYYISKVERNENLDRLCDSKDIKGLKVCLENIDKIEHGGLIIFFGDDKDAEEEIFRLCDKHKRGYHITELNIDVEQDAKLCHSNIGEFISAMAAVDGAILVDSSGNCRAYGVILDGKVQAEGNLKKGARFNSAVIYIYGKNRTALIISEDKEKKPRLLHGKEIEENENLIYD